MSFKKDPNAVLDYTVDWGPWLTPMLDTISTATWIPETGLTVGTTTKTATTATAYVSGGTAGQILKLTCRITTTGGRTDDRTLTLKIAER